MSSRVYKMVRNVDLHVPEKSLEQFTRNRRRRIYEFAHQMEQLCVTSRVKWKEKLEVLRNNHGTAQFNRISRISELICITNSCQVLRKVGRERFRIQSKRCGIASVFLPTNKMQRHASDMEEILCCQHWSQSLQHVTTTEPHTSTESAEPRYTNSRDSQNNSS